MKDSFNSGNIPFVESLLNLEFENLIPILCVVLGGLLTIFAQHIIFNREKIKPLGRSIFILFEAYKIVIFETTIRKLTKQLNEYNDRNTFEESILPILNNEIPEKIFSKSDYDQAIILLAEYEPNLASELSDCIDEGFYRKFMNFFNYLKKYIKENKEFLEIQLKLTEENFQNFENLILILSESLVDSTEKFLDKSIHIEKALRLLSWKFSKVEYLKTRYRISKIKNIQTECLNREKRNDFINKFSIEFEEQMQSNIANKIITKKN